MAVNEINVKFRLRLAFHALLPERVLEAISSVEERCNYDVMGYSVRVQFLNGVWSIPLLVPDVSVMKAREPLYAIDSLNSKEFIVDCLMKYEAGCDT